MKKSDAVLVLYLSLSLFSEFQKLVVSQEDGHHHLSDKHLLLSSRKSSGKTCPTWFTYDDTSGQCICGDDINGVIICDAEGQKVYISACYCMTYDNQTGINVGSCFINCRMKRSNTSFQTYLRLPKNPSDLNDVICGERWNRDGRFCGKCKPDYYPLVYSYDARCIKCANVQFNWLKYVVSAFVPLTVFFVFILGFGVSAYSPQLDTFIIISQIISTPANIRIVMQEFIKNSNIHPLFSYLVRLIAAVYGVWNLDFFRTLLPDNCLKISTLHVLALDYVIALYPLFLILITYILVDLYDRHFWLLIWAWKPFKQCLKSMTSTVNIKSSILNAFGTFILLSYGKFLTVSFDLLVYTRAYAPNGKVVNFVLFYDATIEYFGKNHLPYGILAIAITLVFNILPLLFTLLHLLKCLRGHTAKWPAIRICLDTYQGYYKDGTEGNRDYRFFSALYLLIRISLFVLYALIKDRFYYYAPILLLCLAILIIMFRPFKKQFGIYNSIHAILIVNLAMLFATMACTAGVIVEESQSIFTYILCTVFSILPIFYVTYLVLKWIYSQNLFKKYFRKCCNNCRLQYTMDHHQNGDLSESFPHRMDHPKDEEPLYSNNSSVNLSQYGAVGHTQNSAY